MFKNRYLFFFLHVVLWIGYTANPLLNAWQQDTTKPSVNPYTNPYYWVYVSISSIFLFYFNADFLFPKLYKKQNRPFQYVFILSVVIGILVFFRYLVRVTFIDDNLVLPLFFFNVFIQYLYIFGISTSYRFFSDYQSEQEKQREKENERLKSELSFLRSQISPHFMFNLLNSLVSLARKKSDLVEPALLKMSDLLRYMLYEKDDKKIALEREIEYLKSYVELQKLRFGESIKIDFKIETYNPNTTIEPMLLIPFIENSFKHGVGLVENPFIEIYLRNEKKTLNFSVSNKYNNEFTEQKDQSSGIGLQNIKRRLALLYPKNYHLRISQDENIFKADLEINLNK
jgi:two-component system LytT family sensor kinase